MASAELLYALGHRHPLSAVQLRVGGAFVPLERTTVAPKYVSPSGARSGGGTAACGRAAGLRASRTNRVRKHLPIAAALFLAAPHAARATTDVCAVNPITRQGHVFEDDEYMGIGWRSAGERACASFDEHLAALGYTYTRSPHRLEWLVAAALALAAAALLVRRAWRRR